MKSRSADGAHESGAQRGGFDGYLVCIGASAGGLDALERFFKACPSNTGAAIVVIQHLSPDHKSIMNNLLARHTEMPVIMVEDEMPIEANHVYLIPPGAIMRVSQGHLHLTPKNPRGLTLPIDIFFASLAEVYGPRAVAVILSGTGTDGTRGAGAVNSSGGFVMVQDPESAKFDGMPRSAIATGIFDAILAPEDMPARLVAHIHKLPVAKPVSEVRIVPHAKMNSAEVLAAIQQLLNHASGIDFSDYKPATVLRRIERRMQVQHTPEMHQYLDLLENERNELLTLRRDMLISVTSFFRDPDTFELLFEKVISPMVAEAPTGTTLRVWSAGVATGEEAYSLAMLFIEACERHRRWPNLKVFATDVDQACIETAGIGQYPESTAAELSPERLERFFVKKGNYFVVKNELRQCIVFARHNLLSDPPFTKMDLVVCRNTLIYFKSGAQERALRSLQYAVREGGALLLGPSESLASVSDGLQIVSAKHKLFRRTGASSLPLLDRRGSTTRPLSAPVALACGSGRRLAAERNNIADIGIAALLARYAPAAVVVNAAHEVVHLYGEVSSYFQPREGVASLELNRLLPDNLVPVASALLYKVARDECELVSDTIEVKLANGERRHVRLAAQPLRHDGERLSLLCFEGAPGKGGATPEPVDVDAETVARISVLERELAATRESLQATIEELETSNEELQATNEELMASNEELQSSNEELQSVNEEMSTVNAEFQEKMQILNRINADIDSMAKASGVATVFVNSDMLITRFSPDAMQIFKLRESDIGRRLDDITHLLDYPGLVGDLERTLQTERMIEREVKTLSGKNVYMARILPYAIPSTTLRGAVATFIDISAFHDALRLQTIIDALPEHIAVLDPAGRIVLVNLAWRRFAQANGDPDLRKSGIGVNYLDACSNVRAGTAPDFANATAAAQGVRGVLDGTLPSFSLQYPCHSPLEQRWFVMNVAPVRSSEEFGAVVSHVNISSWFRGIADEDAARR
ncbi:chemotaxis protein CheB [Rhodocyclus purpureus]|uniref:chemotaxis protein CheB n=1 Tax=Rhodocyclus purpureus TaxID=1067 RepID=UPI001912E2A1|nr:chemotaxis protein CheB [Rhodocyclus purpureus]MBK5915781.1 chemotaxis protein CheR [Rhodocyclus purpureus]